MDQASPSRIAVADERFLRRAIELARESMERLSGGPFGAVVVKNGAIVSEGTNSVTGGNDPTAHAEIVAIRRACAGLGAFQLDECDIYSSCEPCPMCLGAIYWARPRAVYFAGSRADAALAGFDDRFIYEQLALPLDRRSLPMLQAMREPAAQVLAEWARKLDKRPY